MPAVHRCDTGGRGTPLPSTHGSACSILPILQKHLGLAAQPGWLWHSASQQWVLWFWFLNKQLYCTVWVTWIYLWLLSPNMSVPMVTVLLRVKPRENCMTNFKVGDESDQHNVEAVKYNILLVSRHAIQQNVLFAGKRACCVGHCGSVAYKQRDCGFDPQLCWIFSEVVLLGKALCSHVHSLDPGVSGYLVGQ